MTSRAFFLLVLILGVGPSCSLMQYRVGQKTIPSPVLKGLEQTEFERQAADLLAKALKEPKSLKPVAEGLSDSLGKPKEPLVSSNPEPEAVDNAALEAIKNLEKGMSKMQKQLDAQNRFLTKYAGTKLEGTGYDLMGPGMVTLVLALIALGVLCPPALTIMFFIYRRVKAAAGIVVNEMEEAAKAPETQEAVKKVKAKIAEKMQKHSQPTTALKAVITDLKS